MNNNFTTGSSTMANSSQPHPSESPAMDTNMNTNTADAASAPPATAPSSGLDLLFAASQVENKPKEAADAAVEFGSAEAVPSTITVVSNGTGSAEAEDESASNSGKEEASSPEHDASASTTDALNDQKVKSFPQVLQEILNT